MISFLALFLAAVAYGQEKVKLELYFEALCM